MSRHEARTAIAQGLEELKELREYQEEVARKRAKFLEVRFFEEEKHYFALVDGEVIAKTDGEFRCLIGETDEVSRESDFNNRKNLMYDILTFCGFGFRYEGLILAATEAWRGKRPLTQKELIQLQAAVYDVARATQSEIKVGIDLRGAR